MTEYEENFITTYTGKKFHYLDPQPEEIDIEDIAHALSLTCRFSGHCKKFYSVAEHSVRVADIVPLELRLQALLHDASEAYITDIPRPIKETFGLQTCEALILLRILTKYGIQGTKGYEIISPAVKEADNILVATEARDLMANMNDWASLPEPLTERISPLKWEDAEELFLFRFKIYNYKEVSNENS